MVHAGFGEMESMEAAMGAQVVEQFQHGLEHEVGVGPVEPGVSGRREPVVDVLLEAEGEAVDVVRLLDALAVLDGTDLISVDSEDTRIRIWIDSSRAGD